jgi:hypothetical protein
VVVLAHDVPAGLRPPGNAVDLLSEQVRDRGHRGRPRELLLIGGQIAREVLDAVPQQLDASVRDLDMGEDVGDGYMPPVDVIEPSQSAIAGAAVYT